MNRHDEVSTPDVDVDLVGNVDGTRRHSQKSLQDTLWIAAWTFDTGEPCSEEGWTHADGYVQNDGAIHWHLESGFTTTTGMQGLAAAVGYHDSSCCVDADGYTNDWYQAIRIFYDGAASLSFDGIVDGESGFDALQVETDSACASFERVDYRYSWDSAAVYRELHVWASGLISNGEWNTVALPIYGPETDCVYIAFYSDGGYSPCDGHYPTTIGEAIVVDNLEITDARGTRREDFEDGSLDIGTFVNIADSTPFGTWARLYPGISDNDVCTENKSCAWLWSDHTTPTLASSPEMAFGPGGYVVKKYLYDSILSPWVSLATTPSTSGTILRFRRFPGNPFTKSCIVQGWSVRGRHAAGEQECSDDWSIPRWNSLSAFRWATVNFDLSPRITPGSDAIQVRLTTSDWGLVADCLGWPPYDTGPGPYVDDIRIGRVTLHGPVFNEGIDARSQAQDCFATEIDPDIFPAGEHYRPTTDRFGTCAFSPGLDAAVNSVAAHVITGDSITIQVRGVRSGGEKVTSLSWHAAIVRGPHVGKAPAPYAVAPNGFFPVTPDSVRGSNGGIVVDNYFVDLDDTYFRGGDVVHYFWAATDSGGGFASDPDGLVAFPGSIAAAEDATGGLLEVSYLPSIDWAPAYLDRIAANPHGDLEPTAGELAASTQSSCLLYVNHVNSRRRSGDANRTSFMYALDRLGYRGHYDVYDHSGMGNTNNHLGGRATVPQARGYGLIVYDTGNGSPGRPLVPDGTTSVKKVDQSGWFQDWLSQAAAGEPGFATLWLLGANLLEEAPALSLYSAIGVALRATNQGMGVNPEVDGLVSYAFDRGDAQSTVDFTGDLYVANGGCPSIRSYDALSATGSAVVTHGYRSAATGESDGGAIVMSSSPAENWNTILQSHPFFDIRDPNGGSPSPALAFLQTILGATLLVDCQRSPAPTGNGADIGIAAPLRTVLHQNVPNPFNPTTEIRFDLARGGKVQLRIYDAAGRLVCTLVDAEMAAGRDQRVLWNGLDDQNRCVASGIYFCRLDAPDALLTRKLVVLQ